MRKFALLLVTMLLLMAGTAQARDKDTLTDLARYYSQDTVAYVGLRTDTDFAGELTSFYDRVRAFFPEVFPPATATDLLDSFAVNMTGSSFEDGVGTWLGETAAVGVSLDPVFIDEMRGDVPPIVISVAITDVEGAKAFVESQLDKDEDGNLLDYSFIERDGFVVYQPNEEDQGQVSIAIGSDVLMMSPSVSLMVLGEIDNALDTVPAFLETIALLPESNYNVIVYADSGEINRTSYYSSMMGMNFAAAMNEGASTDEAVNEANEESDGMLMSLLQVDATQAMGFTILDGDTLTVDIASLVADSELYDEVGIDMQPAPALDTAFTSRIPADAVLVAQSSDFGPTTQLGLDSLRRFGAFVDENGGLVELMGVPREFMDDEELFAMESFSISSMVGAINTGFSGLTGLNLEKDVLPVLNGDVASFVRVLPAQGFMLPVLPDFGMYFQTDNDEGAAMIVDSLHQASQAYGTDYSIEALGEDGAALNLPVLVDALDMGDVPALDVLFGAGNGIFSLGTRPAVESSMGVDANLTDTAAYQAAQAYFLPNTSVLLYIDLAPLADQLASLMNDGMLPNSEELKQALTAMDMLESATGTVTSVDATTSIARFTLTVAEAPVAE